MWVDEGGVAHTVAPLRWQRVVVVVGQVGEIDAAMLLGEIERLRDALIQKVADAQVKGDGYVHALPAAPIEVAAGALSSALALRTGVGQVDWWWRLDVLDALEAMVEERATPTRRWARWSGVVSRWVRRG